MVRAHIKEKLLKEGVRSLKQFGYTTVTEENIKTDWVFRRFFLVQLRDAIGKGADVEINELIREIEATPASPETNVLDD